MTELARIQYHEDLVAIGFGAFLIVMAPLLARAEYRKARPHAPHAKATWVLFAIAQVCLGYALLSTGTAHAWLIAWSGPYDIMPEPVNVCLQISYWIAMAVVALAFTAGGILWLLDLRHASES